MVAVELSKIVVVTINVIFLIFGIAALAIGIVFKVGWDDVRDVFVDNSDKADINLQFAGDTIAYGAIIFGSFIIIVSFVGCIGACCKVRFLLVVYAIIVIILLIGEIVVVALAVSKGSDAKKDIEDTVLDTMQKYKEDSSTDTSSAFSALFSTMECCGVRNYSDFVGINYASSLRPATYLPAKIPITCCNGFDYETKLKATDFDANKECLQDPANSKKAYTEGCITQVEDAIEDNKGIAIGVGVAIFILELLLVLLSFVLCCSSDGKDVHV